MPPLTFEAALGFVYVLGFILVVGLAVAYSRLRLSPSRLPRVSADWNRSSGMERATFIPQYYHGMNSWPNPLDHRGAED